MLLLYIPSLLFLQFSLVPGCHESRFCSGGYSLAALPMLESSDQPPPHHHSPQLLGSSDRAHSDPLAPLSSADCGPLAHKSQPDWQRLTGCHHAGRWTQTRAWRFYWSWWWLEWGIWPSVCWLRWQWHRVYILLSDLWSWCISFWVLLSSQTERNSAIFVLRGLSVQCQMPDGARLVSEPIKAYCNWLAWAFESQIQFWSGLI